MSKVYFIDESGKRFFECNPAETRLAIAAIKKHRSVDSHEGLIDKLDRGEIGLLEVLKRLKIPYELAPEGTIIPDYELVVCRTWDELLENVRKYDKDGETIACADDPVRLRVGWEFQKAAIRLQFPLKMLKENEGPAWVAQAREDDMFYTEEGRLAILELIRRQAKA
jgi:hypothetical protein